ncbi:MAG: HAD family hydrolase [Anaerolineales bacterium]|nr:HAD family hydrolase [Anaerolineales bacterium]
MMPRFLQAVLFDLGDTLMYSPHPWPPVFVRAGQALAASLYASGLSIDSAHFGARFQERLEEYYAERDRNLAELSTLTVLARLLTEEGYTDVPDHTLRAALDKFYAVTQQNWLLEADAVPTLAALQAVGYRLGLVSNAGDNRDVFQLVEKFGIEPYFDFVLTSAACSYRKPHPRIFELALAHWGYMPDQAAMVGDRLDADIGGAKPLGMFTIWIKRRARPQTACIQPDAVVHHLAEIPPLLESLFSV